MKSGYSFSELGFNAWDAMIEAYFAVPGTESVEREQVFKGLVQCQLELWGLTSRRLQACLSMPAELSRSKTPFEILHAQVNFCEVAYQQGAESTRRMADAVGAATGMPNSTETRVLKPVPARDLITLPAGKTPRRVGDGRKPLRPGGDGDHRRVA